MAALCVAEAEAEAAFEALTLLREAEADEALLSCQIFECQVIIVYSRVLSSGKASKEGERDDRETHIVEFVVLLGDENGYQRQMSGEWV